MREPAFFSSSTVDLNWRDLIDKTMEEVIAVRLCTIQRVSDCRKFFETEIQTCCGSWWDMMSCSTIFRPLSIRLLISLRRPGELRSSVDGLPSIEGCFVTIENLCSALERPASSARAPAKIKFLTEVLCSAHQESRGIKYSNHATSQFYTRRNETFPRHIVVFTSNELIT